MTNNLTGPPLGPVFTVSRAVLTASILLMLMLTFGGFGGMINASYCMNTMVHNLFKTHGNAHAAANPEVEYAELVHPVLRMPRMLNGFGFWCLLVPVYMIASDGYPIAQFFLLDTHGTVPWNI